MRKKAKELDWHQFWCTIILVLVTFLVFFSAYYSHGSTWGRPYEAKGFDSQGNIYYEYTD